MWERVLFIVLIIMVTQSVSADDVISVEDDGYGDFFDLDTPFQSGGARAATLADDLVIRVVVENETRTPTDKKEKDEESLTFEEILKSLEQSQTTKGVPGELNLIDMEPPAVPQRRRAR